MSRVEADHLAREAIVYVRQSTIDQVNNNVESRRRQYGLVERARLLGWANVSVIDDDLGRSGSGVSRPGFEKLLAAICDGRVGAVVSIEASRLARNGRDWHTLLEFCGLVGTLIADEDGVYLPTPSPARSPAPPRLPGPARARRRAPPSGRRRRREATQERNACDTENHSSRDLRRPKMSLTP